MSKIEKACNKCGEVKSLAEFYKNSRMKDGYRNDCKICERHMYRNSRVRYQFKITVEQYDRMFDAQKGCCAICGKPEERSEDGVTTRLCIDHDHKTNKVRGLLCRKCNSALGLINDDISILLACVKYLTKPITS